jgi:hypothetical protein
MVAQEVAWFKKYRDILESDIIHGRRPDATSLDWSLHVNPQLATPGMLVVFNPTSKGLSEKLKVPMHYTGLSHEAVVYDARAESGQEPDRKALPISVNEILELDVVVPAYSMRSFAFAGVAGGEPGGK